MVFHPSLGKGEGWKTHFCDFIKGATPGTLRSWLGKGREPVYLTILQPSSYLLKWMVPLSFFVAIILAWSGQFWRQ